MGHRSVRIEALGPRRLFDAGHLDTSFRDKLFGSDPGQSDIFVPNLHEVVDLDVSSIGQIFVTTLIHFGERNLPGGAVDTDSFSVLVHRLHPDGTRNGNFGTVTNGSFVLGVSPTVFRIDGDVTLEPRVHTHVQSDDSLLVHVGNLIYKYRPDGRPDESFGTRGRMTARVFEPQLVQDVTMDSAGRVIVIGALRSTTAIARLATNGKPDLSFNPSDPLGVLAPFPDGSFPREMVAQTLPDGGMILGGIAEGTLPPGEDFSASFDLDLVKLTPDGAIDTSYGAGGIVHEQEASTDLYLARAHNPGILGDGTFFYTHEDFDRDLLRSFYQTLFVTPDRGEVLGADSDSSIDLARDGELRVTITDEYGGTPLGKNEVLFLNDLTGSDDPAARAATQAVFGEQTAPLKAAFQPDGSVLVLASNVSTTDDPDRTLSVFRLQRDESPAGLLDARTLAAERDASYRFGVYWRDEDGIDAATLGDDDLRVLFPDGTSRRARLVESEEIGDDKLVLATYLVTSPDGRWDADDNGRYQVRVERKSVRDPLGNPAGRRVIGGFVVRIAEESPAVAPFTPSPGTPGEGGGEGSRSTQATHQPYQPRRTLTLPSPGVPGEGEEAVAADLDRLLA